MTVSYDLEKIKKIIDDLHRVTGLSIGFMDIEFNYLYRSLNKEDSYCSIINATAEGRSRCLCSDRDMTKRCLETMKPVSHVCHAGVIDTTVPIIKGGVLCAFIIIGRIRKEGTEGLSELLSWMGEDKKKVIPHYERLSYFSKMQLESLIDIISGIIFESSIFIKHNNVADAAKDHIERNLQSDLSVEELCATLYTSKNKLYADFRAAFGTTVNEYITERRMERARRLLKESDMSVREISSAVGIDNPPYFSELFKKRCNMTPREYRESFGKATDQKKQI